MTKKRALLNKKDILYVVERLKEGYPDAKPELDFTNAYELLIATILSAQCTDVRVNIVTKELFKIVKEPKDLIELGIEKLEEIIKPCGIYKNKAKGIYNSSRMIIEDYNGEVPREIKTLMKLPSVGQKTANVVASNAYGVPAIAVDTHVFRVSNRIGIVNADNVKDTEEQLKLNVKEEDWIKTHHTIIFHGRRVCKARKPDCENCFLSEICLHKIKK